jgi:hypothetical protein
MSAAPPPFCTGDIVVTKNVITCEFGFARVLSVGGPPGPKFVSVELLNGVELPDGSLLPGEPTGRRVIFKFRTDDAYLDSDDNKLNGIYNPQRTYVR